MNFTFKTKITIVVCLVQVWGFTLEAQILATFEDDHLDHLQLSDEWYDSTLFVSLPGIYQNPDNTGINTSAKCFGATNTGDADWWGNFVCLTLDSSVVISSSNRFLSFMMYRSIQPKELRIGFNGREEWNEIFFGKATENATWEKVTIDLFNGYEGQELNQIWIIFSCNWYDPRTGWGEASYYFDNFEFTGTSTISMSVTIDAGTKYQEIDGFGASDCWTGNFVGKWDDSERHFIAEKLFSREFDDEGNPKGIGLSMWRFNLGAGTFEQGAASGIDDESRRAESFLDNPGSYNWTKQAGQQYFLNQAVNYGCEQLVAFSNSPPITLTKNGKGFADPGGVCNLAEDKFDDFAEYLTTVLDHFSENGIEFSYISPVNEPQHDWTGGQEGSPWENSDIKNLAVHLDASIQAKELNTKILLAEAGSWTSLYQNGGRASNQIYELFSNGSENYVGNLATVAPVITGHSYWTFRTNEELRNVRLNVRNHTEFQFLKSYQTEWSLLGDAPDISTGFPASYEMASYMDIALFMAKVIQADLNFANVSSWSYWTAMDMERWSQKNRFFLIRVTPSDGNYGSLLNSGTADDTPSLWVLGNFSLFIRPGFKRIRIEGADDMNALFGTAYISPDSGRIVAVYVNTGYSDIQLSTKFNNLDYSIQSVRNYITSSGSGLERDTALPENYTGEIISLQSRSVSTVVYDLDIGMAATKDHPGIQSEVKIFPNPVSPGFSIDIVYNDSHFSDNPEIDIISMEGQIIQNVRIQQGAGTYRIGLPPDIPRGIYILSLKDKTYRNCFKIMVN